MANAIPIRVPGTGGPTLQYVLPANMMQFVQSVNAVIDNSGGADAKPILTVLDSTSEVIADVPQGRSIPAGDSGRATWALRLADETPAASPAGAGMHVIYDYEVTAVGGQAKIDTLNDGPNAGLLPQSFTSLRVLARLRKLQGPTGTGNYATILLNHLSTAGLYDYFWSDVQGAPGAGLLGGAVTSSLWVTPIPAGPAGQGPFGSLVMDLPWYADASTWQTASWIGGEIIRLIPGAGEIATFTGQLRVGVGVNRIELQAGSPFDAFAAGSRLTIFAG